VIFASPTVVGANGRPQTVGTVDSAVTYGGLVCAVMVDAVSP